MPDEQAKFLLKRLRKERCRVLQLDRRKTKRRIRAAYKHALKSAKSQTPKWCDRDKLLEIYDNRPKEMQVDHVIPLHGDLVSGLHIPENLQYLNGEANYKKWNKFTPYREIDREIVEYY